MTSGSDDDSDFSDDDLLQPTFKKTRTERNKDQKMHNYLDTYLEKQEERLTQKELIRDMQKQTTNVIKIKNEDITDNTTDHLSSGEKNCSKEAITRRKLSIKTEQNVDQIDMIEQEYKSIMEDHEKESREKRRRELRNAADGIDNESQALNKKGMLDAEFYDDEGQADLVTAQVTGLSSKLGVRNVLLGSEIDSKSNQNSSLQLYLSEAEALKNLEKILSKHSRSRGKMAKHMYTAILLPMKRALKAKVLQFFLNNETLVLMISKLSLDDANVEQREVLNNILQDIIQWLWNLACSSGYPGIDIYLREGAMATLIKIVKNQNFNKLRNKNAEVNLQFPLFSLSNLLQGFKLATGYRCPVLPDEKGDTIEDINSKNDRAEDILVIKNCLQIWNVAFETGVVYWEDEVFRKGDDKELFKVEDECLEVLLFASLDHTFYSGNSLLESLQKLISSMLKFVLKKSESFSERFNRHCFSLFFEWITSKAVKIIGRLQCLCPSSPKANDEDDVRNFLALALLVGNISIFKNDLKIDLLGIILKSKMCELALHLCLFDCMPEANSFEESKLNSTDDCRNLWKGMLNDSFCYMLPTKEKGVKKREESTSCYCLVWKNMALATIGLNSNIPSKVKDDGPRFHSSVLIAHICAEMGNSLLLFPDLESIDFLREYGQYNAFNEIENKTVDVNDLIFQQSFDPYNSPTLYDYQIKIMHDKLNVLEKYCHALRKSITSVFIHAHLRRAKELLVYLEMTYRSWKTECSKKICLDNSCSEKVSAQGNLNAWMKDVL